MDNQDKLLEERKRINNIVKSVLGSGQGIDLMKTLNRIYVECNLYEEDARKTAYLIGQRDLIMQLQHIIRGKENE